MEEFGAPLPEGPGKFRDMKRARNGNLYSPPLNANRVLKIDPVKGTAELVGKELGYGVQTGDCLGTGPCRSQQRQVVGGGSGQQWQDLRSTLQCSPLSRDRPGNRRGERVRGPLGRRQQVGRRDQSVQREAVLRSSLQQ